MKKLFDKNELLFALLWILVYVLGFGNADSISESLGIPKFLTVPVGLVLSLLLYGFIRKYRLQSYFGLCKFTAPWKRLLWFFPLAAISSVNLWNGLTFSCSGTELALHVLSMCFVAFLEEVIFRGLLFRAMVKTNRTTAILVSSLTFGAGHIVNLLIGAPFTDTLLQLVYASAVGFCYVAVFLTCGSIVPCILSHALVNSMSILAIPATGGIQLGIAAAQTVLSVSYGLWLLRRTAVHSANKQ